MAGDAPLFEGDTPAVAGITGSPLTGRVSTAGGQGPPAPPGPSRRAELGGPVLFAAEIAPGARWDPDICPSVQSWDQPSAGGGLLGSRWHPPVVATEPGQS